MFIRMLFGRYAGETLDVREEEAHRMIANGDAENPYAEVPGPEPELIQPKKTPPRRKR